MHKNDRSRRQIFHNIQNKWRQKNTKRNRFISFSIFARLQAQVMPAEVTTLRRFTCSIFVMQFRSVAFYKL